MVWTRQEFVGKGPKKMLKGRGSSKAIDDALARYEDCVWKCQQLLRNARVCCVEDDSVVSAVSNRIEFSFPGFDTQQFELGKLAVVEPFKFFRGTPHCYSDSQWSGSLGSNSVAKELMQSSPDVSDIFDSDPAKAKQVMFETNLSML